MPNWCYTTLTITGSEEKIKELSELINSTDELCNALIPRPETEQENWYDWNCENWGSKWDVRDLQVEWEEADEIHLSFSTAWSPIVPIFQHLEKLGFEVNAEYKDECYMFAGQYEGEVNTLFDIMPCKDCADADDLDLINDCETCEGEGAIVLR